MSHSRNDNTVSLLHNSENIVTYMSSSSSAMEELSWTNANLFAVERLQNIFEAYNFENSIEIQV